MMSVLVNIFIVLLVFIGLYTMQKKEVSFGKRVLSGLFAGIILGTIFHLIFGANSAIIKETNNWLNIVGSGYIRLLTLIVTPLVLVSITSSIIQTKDLKTFRKTGLLIIGILLFTTAIAAAVGAGSAIGFNLSANGMEAGNAEIGASQKIETKLTDFQAKPIQQQLIEIIPTNVFYALTGQSSSATLSVVFLSILLGISILKIRQYKPQSAEFLTNAIESLQDIVMEVVEFVLKITPYGVLVLITKFISTSNLEDILKLVQFVIASYTAIFIMFIVHFILLSLSGFNPLIYIQKAAPVLAFAFTSRTSAGTLPLTVEALTNKLGVSKGIANLAASFGVSIGQNGCAGIYPAMLAVMIAPTVGIDPLAPLFLIKLILVVTFASFGIAGVGGGATFASLVVLSTMGLPVGLVGLLIAIEPLIDMGRTALNVSDAMTTAIIADKISTAPEN
ncbi:L-cystine transporter [Propionispira raffinosivorans]|uniref:L-cystine transporter n=1 Tax=Propionispira raffinosivorans TaxID=86959 RepID=UPI000362E901|nr:cation:dicarboxylase symporter family transporter [Propionispira raffinosivorans]